MIKIFRNIRRNLLKDGNKSSYIKYAIGEIVLVMIGILLALQVNNWNEKRIERNEIKAKLNRILEEIQATQLSIANEIKALDSLYIGDNKKSLQYLKSGHKDLLQLLENTLGNFGNATTVVIDIPAIEDFINSGHLSKVSDNGVKTYMLIAKRLQNFSRTLDKYANDQLNSHISPYFIKKLNLAQLTKNSDMVVLNPIEDFSQFVGDRELENLINIKIETDTGKRDFLSSLNAILFQLDVAIKRELKD